MKEKIHIMFSGEYGSHIHYDYDYDYDLIMIMIMKIIKVQK
jgi:hypothetical protein